MKLVITESAAVPEITDVIFDSKNDYLKLDEAGKYVLTLTETTTTSDAASSMQRFEVAVTNADNVLCDTVTILVENTDDADVSLALSGDNLTQLLNGLPGVNAYELDASAVSRHADHHHRDGIRSGAGTKARSTVVVSRWSNARPR